MKIGSGDYEDCLFGRCESKYFSRKMVTFQRNMLPASSERENLSVRLSKKTFCGL